jgi:hypothetical protein
MEAIVGADLRVYAAPAVIALGLALVLRAVRLARASWRRPLTTSMEPLGWLRGFRLAIIGLAVAGVGAAWLWQAAWLFWLALAVAFEETIETSIAIGGLLRGARPVAGAPRTAARPAAGRAGRYHQSPRC